MSNDNSVRIQGLLDYIRQGRSMDAMREFYAEGVVMEEPAYGKTVGLEANLIREEKFVASVKEFRGFEAPKVGVGEDVSFYENVVVAQWKNGKIVHERFYYNTA